MKTMFEVKAANKRPILIWRLPIKGQFWYEGWNISKDRTVKIFEGQVLYGKTANVKAKFNMRLELKDGMAEIFVKAKFYGKTANVKTKFNMRPKSKDGMAEIFVKAKLVMKDKIHGTWVENLDSGREVTGFFWLTTTTKKAWS